MRIPFFNAIETYFRKRKYERELLKKHFYELRDEVQALRFALCDSKYGLMSLRMDNASILDKYRHAFCKIRENDVCIDCGANIGLVSDIFLSQGAEVYAFEPHDELSLYLKDKYLGESKMHFYDKAVGDKNEVISFKKLKREDSIYLAATQGATACKEILDSESYYEAGQIECIDLCAFIRDNFVNQNKRVYILKMDVEGAEFDILFKLINEGLYEHIDYLFCETHARVFDDGEEKLNNLKNLISERNIKNIYLDWV